MLSLDYWMHHTSMAKNGNHTASDKSKGSNIFFLLTYYQSHPINSEENKHKVVFQATYSA